MSMLWKMVSIVTLVAVIGVAALVVAGKNPVANAAAAAQDTGSDQAGITISAQGMVTAKPDLAHITFGVRTTAATAAEAMGQNNTALTAVLSKLEGLGLAKTDIQTGMISLQPQTSFPKPDQNTVPEIVGYWATNNLNVTVKDVAKVGDILDAAIAAGANTIDGIRFDVNDNSALEDQALQAAVKNARAKADVVAEGLGLKVTGVKNVVVDSYTPIPYYASAAMMGKGGDASVPVEAGEIQVNAMVRVTFSF